MSTKEEKMYAGALKDLLIWVVDQYGQDWDATSVPDVVTVSALLVGNPDVASILRKAPAQTDPITTLLG